MELPIETALTHKKPTIRARLSRRVRQTYNYDTAFWRRSIAGPWGAGMFVFILAALGMPTGIGAGFDTLLFMLTGTIAIFLFSNLTAVILALTGLPIPRLFTGAVLFNFPVSLLVFSQHEESWSVCIAISVIITGTGLAVGILAGLLGKLTRTVKSQFYLVAAASLILLLLLIFQSERPGIQSVETLANSQNVLADASADSAVDSAGDSRADSAAASSISNPAEPGSYNVQHFTYGSGKDIWQPEFGADVDLISESVDAGNYIKKWSKVRSFYWGFNQHSLPLNGRVWMPEGSGKHPIALILHGNHLMEDFSDGGYAYLGELLASRGIIAVSIDENFLNYSTWTGIPDNDMKVRAWMLLKHLQQIRQFTQESGNPFHQKIDFGQIALIGHSRGGQAAAMAADAKRWFRNDDSLADIDTQFDIQAVAALAPTDKKVDGMSAKLQNVSYLTLQGAKDGDVNDFDGDRQYMRTSFTRDADHFKASLYIADANHSQFNTGWGNRDISYPKGLFLTRKDMLSADEQREIAKVYITAFLETSLHGKQEFIPILKDYRNAQSWLPSTSYFNRYEDGHFTLWAAFDEDMTPATTPKGGEIVVQGLDYKEEEIMNRRNSAKGSRAAVIERSKSSVEDSSFTLQWKTAAPVPSQAYTAASDSPNETATGRYVPQALSFSLADRTFELEEQDTESPGKESSAMVIHIELRSANGIAVKLPLEDFMEIKAPPGIDFTLHPWLENRMSKGKYKYDSEAVFQTFHIPMTAFIDTDPAFDPTRITSFTIHLTGGAGRIMVDDIGIY